MASRINNDVLQLDVSMSDVPLVKVVNGAQELLHNLLGLVLAELPVGLCFEVGME